MKSNRGSITLFVLISVLFFAAILTISYISAINKTNSQAEQIDIIKENYAKNIGNEEEVYKNTINRTKVLKIGDYIEYDVSYTDVYSNYEFTQNNGWRILDPGTRNLDGTYSNVKLISTGVPVQLKYNYETIKQLEKNGTDGNWAGDEIDRQNYVDIPSIEKGEVDDAGIYAASGLYYNFEKIIFNQGTTQTENQGCYLKVNNKESGSITGEEFIVKGKAEEVHELTLHEINISRGFKDKLNDKTSVATTDGITGLFYLKNLNNYNYSSDTNFNYWLASFYSGSEKGTHIRWLDGASGGIGYRNNAIYRTSSSNYIKF